MSKTPGRKILFPTRIAVLLVLPSLLLYVFFNTWPMIFSIGIAFTNAQEKNLLPNPKRIVDLENAIACATLLRDNPDYRVDVSELIKRSHDLLNKTMLYFEEIKCLFDSGADVFDIPTHLYEGVYRSTFALRRIREGFVKHLNCTELGYVTSLDLIPRDALENMDRLMTLGGYFATPSAFSRDELYNYTLVGINLIQKLVDYIVKLEYDYEGYMNSFIESARRELEDLELSFVGLENFKRLFTDPRFYNSLYKTLLFVATSVPLKVSLGVLLALFYSSDLVVGRRALRALLLVPWAIPFLLSAMTWKFLFLPNGQLGLAFNLDINRDEWHAFLVYNLFETWLAYPFVMTVTMGALRGVPKDIIEASYIDGAGVFCRFKRIVLPQIWRPVAVAAILTTGASLQAFLVPLTLNGAGPSGYVCMPYLGCKAGWLNEMLIVFGYNRIMIDREYAYAASMYIVVVAIILVYVAAWFKVMRRAQVR